MVPRFHKQMLNDADSQERRAEIGKPCPQNWIYPWCGHLHCMNRHFIVVRCCPSWLALTSDSLQVSERSRVLLESGCFSFGVGLTFSLNLDFCCFLRSEWVRVPFFQVCSSCKYVTWACLSLGLSILPRVACRMRESK